MSVQASSWVISNSKHKGAGLLCLMMIANHAHSDGTNAFPSIPTLAKECRMSERQIQRIIQVLECSGELLVERSAGRKSHTFAVVMGPPVPKLPAEKMPAESAGEPDLNGDIMSETNGDIMSGSDLDEIPNGDILDTPTVTYSMFNGDISHTPSPYMNRPEPSFEPEESARTAPAPVGAPTPVDLDKPCSLFGDEDALDEKALGISEPAAAETVASACNSFGASADGFPPPVADKPRSGFRKSASGLRKSGMEPGAYTSQAMIGFDRMFVRQRRLDEKDVRHPIRDLRLEAEAQRRYDAVGPNGYDTALQNFFSCLDGTDPYVATRGYDLALFIRQFEKWEGGRAVPVRSSSRPGIGSRSSDGSRSSPPKTGGESGYLSAAQIIDQRNGEAQNGEASDH